jgi:transposase
MHTITVHPTEITRLRTMLHRGTEKARVLTRARVLIRLHERRRVPDIAHEAFVSIKTVGRIATRYHDGGIERALYDLPRPGQPPIITPKVEAYLVAVACTDAPIGHDHWTLELLRTRLIEKKKVRRISSVAILKHLRKRGIKPWREKNVVHTLTHP